jgi:hypothetical protein
MLSVGVLCWLGYQHCVLVYINGQLCPLVTCWHIPGLANLALPCPYISILHAEYRQAALFTELCAMTALTAGD